MKITVITTGGTIECVGENGVLRPAADIGPLVGRAVKAGAPQADCEVSPLMKTLSENADGRGVAKIVGAVKRALESSDGVIVTHGTDTLDVTAAALSYALGSQPAPVVMASAMRPPFTEGSDAPLCLAACAAVASSGMRGVYAVSASGDSASVFRGSRLMPFAPYSDKMTALGGRIAEYDGGKLSVYPSDCEPDGMPPADVGALLSPSDVMLVMPQSVFALPEPPEGVRKVLFPLFHSATLPTAREDFVRYCRKCAERGISLYATSAFPHSRYESAELFGALGITVMPPIAPASAAMKLRLGLKTDVSLGGDICRDPSSAL